MKDKIVWALVGWQLAKLYYREKCDNQIMLLTQGTIPQIPDNLNGTKKTSLVNSAFTTYSKKG